MNPNEEAYLPGGIYFQGNDTDSASDRTDISMNTSPGLDTEEGNVQTLGLSFVTGNSVYNLVGITPEDMRRLGKWVIQTTNELS